MTNEQIDALLLTTAYHEAGHVVASLVCQLPFESVTLLPLEEALRAGGPPPAGETDGSVVFPNPLKQNGINLGGNLPLSSDELTIVHRSMVLLFAGYFGDMLISKNHDTAKDGAKADFRHVAAMAHQMATQPGMRSPEDYLDEAQRCAEDLIDATKEMVEKVACELLRRGTLAQDEAIAAAGSQSLTDARGLYSEIICIHRR